MNNLLRFCPACSRSHTVTSGAIAFDTRQVLQLSFYFFFYFFILPQRLNSLSCRFYFVSSKAPQFRLGAINIILENDQSLEEYGGAIKEKKEKLLKFSLLLFRWYVKRIHPNLSIVSPRYRKNRWSNVIFQINVRPRRNVFEVLGLRGNLGEELEFFQLFVAQLLEEIFEPREIFREKFGEQDPRLIKMFLTSFNFFLFFCQAYRFEREKHPFPANSSICPRFRFEAYSVPYNWRTRRNFVSNGSVDCGKTLPSLSN